MIIRLVFFLFALTGIGLVAYPLAFALLRDTNDDPLPDGWTTNNTNVLGLGLFTAGVMLLVQRLGISLVTGSLIWPVLAIAAVVGAIAWRLSLGRQQRLAQAFLPNSRLALVRVLAGIAIVGGGIMAFLLADLSLSVLGGSVIALVLIFMGAAVVFGPWMVSLVDDLGHERRLRVRADERADLAAHLHDSVLQTLALIQRTDDPAEASALARRQERELRSWLYNRPESFVHADVDLETVFESAVADVESRHAVPIELIVVGNTTVDDSVISLAQAAREAMVNASKFSGAPHVSAYVEADDGQVEVWVRDTGVGFDPATIGDDRRGIRDSINRRLERIGGEATITSAPGQGTEVYLLLPAQRKDAQ